MIHSRMKTLHALVAVLIVLPLYSCATATRSDPLRAAVEQLNRDCEDWKARVLASDDALYKLEQREKVLLPQLPDDALKAYAELKDATHLNDLLDARKVPDEAQVIMATRKLFSLLADQPSLAAELKQNLLDQAEIKSQMPALLAESLNLDNRRKQLIAAIQARIRQRRQDRMEWEQMQQAYIEQQNWNNLNNEIRDLGNTIQNNSRGGGATVVVPR
jgi:ATP-dependent Lon protease